MEWLVSNWETILTVSVAVLAAASVVTKLTPTPVDDTVVAFLQRLMGFLSGLNHSDVGGVKAPLTKPKMAPEEPADGIFRKRDRG